VRDNRLGYSGVDQISRQEKQFSKLYIIENCCTSIFYKHFRCSLCQTKIWLLHFHLKYWYPSLPDCIALGYISQTRNFIATALETSSLILRHYLIAVNNVVFGGLNTWSISFKIFLSGSAKYLHDTHTILVYTSTHTHRQTKDNRRFDRPFRLESLCHIVIELSANRFPLTASTECEWHK
jgi:hypothetical protein